MKKVPLILAAVAAVFALADAAAAAGKANPFNVPTHSSGGSLFKKKALPAFQAAPWYLYWPYNSHFQMPAPLPGHDGFGGGFGGGHAPGHGWTNPYFPNTGK